jgi:hypothetical protein
MARLGGPSSSNPGCEAGVFPFMLHPLLQAMLQQKRSNQVR